MPVMPDLMARRITRDACRWTLYISLLAVLAIFLIWPIVLAVQGGFFDVDGRFTLRYIVAVFQDVLLLEGLRNSLLIAVFTTILCLIIALPLSVVAVRYAFPGKTLMSGLILVPLILPPFVGAIGMRALLGRFGAINTFLFGGDEPGVDFLGGALGGRFWSVVVMQALHLYPILYLNVTAALANLDPALNEAAENLGAGRVRRFFRCTLPLILPGIFAGSTIVFIWSFTELGTPLMFDYYTVTPVQVFWGITELEASPQPYALVVVMLSVALLAYVLGKFVFGRQAYEMQAKASVAATTINLRGIKALAALALFVGITLIATLPHLGVVISSLSEQGAWYRSVLPTEFTLRHYTGALGHDLAMTAITNSLQYAVAAMILCVLLGLTISYFTVRVKMPGSWILDSLAMLPLAVPGLVMAFGYVAMSLSWPFRPGAVTETGFLQVLGNDPNPIPLLIIAYAIRRLPYIVRAASAGLQQTSGLLEEAALNLGCSVLYNIRRVVVPLIMANLIAGSVLVFAFSMLEVSDSLILAQKQEHYPITKAIYELFFRLGDGPYIASAMGVWGMVLLTITLVGAGILMGRKLGAIFRV